MSPKTKRCSGILCHITSLPSGSGIGSLGPEALAFLDFLVEANQSLWQVLPVGPVDVALVLDPMLATGGSSCAALAAVKSWGVRNIKLLSIIAAPEGLKVLSETHPDVPIYCAALDDHLNEHNYIVPGLGDAGDRIFGTK